MIISVKKMCYRSKIARLACYLGLIAPAMHDAVAVDDPLKSVSLEALLDLEVETVIKDSQKATDAPAIVTVITAQDIRKWGYRSVADALAHVPGLYAVNDHLSPNFGVRGNNGGLRAYSRNLKVMINMQPVSFRSDSANYLGPELIPMSVIRRIEVVRGPSSALYGPNAFLGVVNIITKDAVKGTTAKTSATMGSDGFVGWAGMASHGTESGFLSVALSAENATIAAMPLPETSPSLEDFTPRQSVEADSKPRSAFIQGAFEHGQFSTEVFYHFTRLDSVAQFLDFGTLSPENRVVLQSDTFRVRENIAINEQWALSAYLAYAGGQPGSNESLREPNLSGDPATNGLQRDFSYSAWDVGLEAQYQFASSGSVTFGVDYTDDTETLMRVYQTNLETGDASLVSRDQGELGFRNEGLYVQYVGYPWARVGFTFNARYDEHNIYGDNTNFRTGFVYQLDDNIITKLLYGTSFKAPTAMQLFAEPLYPAEIVGNDKLKPEESATTEAELLYKVNDDLAIKLNLFYNEVEDRAELTPFGISLTPQNIGEQRGYGAEGEVNWFFGRQVINYYIAWQDTINRIEHPFLGVLESPSDLAPRLSSHLRWQYNSPEFGTFGISVSYFSERRATRSNIRENERIPYELDPYTLVGGVYTARVDNVDLQFKVENFLNKTYIDPGFAGTDVPGKGRRFFVSVGYHF